MSAQTRTLAAQYQFNIDADRTVAAMPLADCQIVEVLKALRRKASVIVMDEPTSSLSEVEAQRLFAVIKQLRAQGLAIIYISHRLEEVIGLADDISVLRDGKVVDSAPARNLDIPGIVQHMVGRELTDFFRLEPRGPVRRAFESAIFPRTKACRTFPLKCVAGKSSAWPA